MKILLCHNYYQQPGGEDLSFEGEAGLLERHGHEVLRYRLHNDAISSMAGWNVAAKTIWNQRTYGDISRLIRSQRPSLMHCTNTFPLISPAAYYAARAYRVPVVQSLRNYRLICPNSYLLRNNRICSDCVTKTVPWPGIIHRCYRQSRAATAVVASLVSIHRVIGTWRRMVSLYFTPSEFAKTQFVRAGFAREQIAVKPNFVDPDPGPGPGDGNSVVFVGRLSPEKDIKTLLSAWSGVRLPVTLQIVGDGPMSVDVRAAMQSNTNIQWLGQRPHQEVLSIIGQAKCLIMPSRWYETFGRTIMEAFAKGTPVIASSIGAMGELVEHQRTGMVFEPGRPDQLLTALNELLSDPEKLASMRLEARRAYETNFTAARNYVLLMDIYQRAGQRATLSNRN